MYFALLKFNATQYPSNFNQRTLKNLKNFNNAMDFLLKNPEDENVHFIDDSEYKGTWNALGMEGIGKYVLPHS